MPRSELIEYLKSNPIKIGTDGFVRLVDVMGEDSSIIQAARVSYGTGTKTVLDDEGLIRYLMRHRHTTPFEMAEVKFHIRIPMDTWRQFIRHRTANVNEYSTRYSEAIDSMAKTDPDFWRLQSQTNKQGSGDCLRDWPDDPGFPRVLVNPDDGEDFKPLAPGDILSALEEGFHKDATELYQMRIKAGIAREQARKDLPLSTYTEAYWKCDLHNIFHFLGLRMDSHAQLEIRQYANAMGEGFIQQLFPLAWQAFLDYRLNAVSLSARDIEAFHRLFNSIATTKWGDQGAVDCAIDGIFTNKRERTEFLEKFKRIYYQ